MFCRITRILSWSAVAYFLYLALFQCRGNYPECVVPQYTCASLNTYVYPFWDQHVHPHIAELDAKYGISKAVAPHVKSSKAKIAAFDEKFQVSYNFDVQRAKTCLWLQKLLGHAQIKAGQFAAYHVARGKQYYQGNMGPMILYYFDHYKRFLVHSVDALLASAKVSTKLFLVASKRHTLRFFTYQVVPVICQGYSAIVNHPYVVKASQTSRFQYVVSEVKRILAILVEKSAKINDSLQEKSDFVKAEFNNLVNAEKFDQFKKKFKGPAVVDQDILEVVNEILEDVTNADEESGGPVATGDVKEPETPATEEDSVPEAVPDASDEESEEETITIQVTSTITIVEEGAHTDNVAVVENTGEEIANFGESSSKAQIEHELKYWQGKVDKTLDMAYKNLEDEMVPFLETFVSSLKEQISENFTSLQQGSYERYKVMGELITEINKDSEAIRETGEIIEEPVVDRQIMRDKIKEAYDVVEGMMKDVEVVLNDAHAKILEKYFEVTQDTVDVLESFADSTMLDFSFRLTGLLSVLESEPDFEDELSWSAWKKFHKVKEDIFKIRDSIFDEAQEFKQNPRTNVKPRGLDIWVEYLKNINFHINFLLRDNDDYLKLVRAQANVAYQLREGLSHELAEAAKEAKQAAEAKQKSEETVEAPEPEATEDLFVDAILEQIEAVVPSSSFGEPVTFVREDPEATEEPVTEVPISETTEPVEPIEPAEQLQEEIEQAQEILEQPVDQYASEKSFDEDDIVANQEVQEESPEALEA